MMNILAVVEPKEATYIGQLRGLAGDNKVFNLPKKIEYLSPVDKLIAKIYTDKGFRIQRICTTNIAFVKLLVKDKFKVSFKTAKADESILHAYAGSMFFRTVTVGEETWTIPIIVLPPLQTIHTKTYGKFLLQRYMDKLVSPTATYSPEMHWQLIDKDTDDWNSIFDNMNRASLIAVDVETVQAEADIAYAEQSEYRGVSLKGVGFVGKTRTKSGGKSKKIGYMIPKLTCVGYTCIFPDLTSFTYVLPVTDMNEAYLMRKLNTTSPPKVMHNGRYDSMYFMRYSAPLTNYTFDTYMMMHAWYAELPKTLAFVSAFMLRDHMFWKDESGDNLYEYNAKDCHATAWACLYMLQEMPEWATANFVENFPKIFPSIQCGVEGFKVDHSDHDNVKARYEEELARAQAKLEAVTGTPRINAASPKQMKELLKGVGFNATGTDAKTLAKMREGNTFWEVISNAISSVREHKKAVSTYMNIEYFDGRLLYELDPSGTETGRFASKASSFWCGTQVQNIPLYAKSMYVADDGYVLVAIDNGQSESRCTAYISEDENLMETVEDDRDFHRVNATLFFGLEYEEITKAIRVVAKRINHGANYNMGAGVLLETMGTRAVIGAKRLLGLPDVFSPLDVCGNLLERFARAYPRVKRDYYNAVIKEIADTHMLTGETGWTRYCFGDPTASKMNLNSYVAHHPQSLSVKIINQSFFDCWLRLQVKENIIRLKAQVHDEIIYQVKPEHLDYSVKVISELMERPTMVKGRAMVIPNDPITNKHRWNELK